MVPPLLRLDERTTILPITTAVASSRGLDPPVSCSNHRFDCVAVGPLPNRFREPVEEADFGIAETVDRGPTPDAQFPNPPMRPMRVSRGRFMTRQGIRRKRSEFGDGYSTTGRSIRPDEIPTSYAAIGSLPRADHGIRARWGNTSRVRSSILENERVSNRILQHHAGTR